MHAVHTTTTPVEAFDYELVYVWAASAVISDALACLKVYTG